MAKKKSGEGIWDGITEDDFLAESNIIDEDVADYNMKGMGIYSANVNLQRYTIRVIDSLKPVERRILYAMYNVKAIPGHMVKSEEIIAAAMRVHHHGDMALYESMVNMVQHWKKNVPLITGDCNYGSITSSDTYAAKRYTEAEMTDYAFECFFEDYNEKAVPMDEHLTGAKEPVYLPTKFPNVLVNGTNGISYGFAPFIPPYNCNDVVDICTKLIRNPEDPDILIYPDLPTGCDIVDDPGTIRRICEEGKGTLRMRARIDIDGESDSRHWILRIRSIPFTVRFNKIYEQILKLGKQKAIPFDDLQQNSIAYEENGIVKTNVDLSILLPRSMDPKAIRSMLFKNTDLEKTISVNFTVIVGDREIKTVSLRELALAWINARREYKRALYNHKHNHLLTEISIRDIMIELCDKDNVEKTLAIVKHSNTDEIISRLCEEYGMDSHQAKVVANKPLQAFSKDAKDRYIEERKKLSKDLEAVESVIRSSKKQDAIIIDELADLRKYATPRKSPIITIDGEEIISDTDHFIITTAMGKIKKLPFLTDKSHMKNRFGTFEQGDYPQHVFKANNLDTFLFMDTTGSYTIMPVYQIPNTLYKDYGESIYSVTRLQGAFVYVMKIRVGDASIYKGKGSKKKNSLESYLEDITIVTLTESGYMKKTKLGEYVQYNDDGSVKYLRGSKAVALRDGDLVKQAGMWHLGDEADGYCRFLVYTDKGDYVLIQPGQIPTMGKRTQGNLAINTDENNRCSGMSIICDNDDWIVVITAKGYVRKEAIQYYENSKSRRDNHKLCNVEDDDKVIFAMGCKTEAYINVKLKSGDMQLTVSEIPEIPRRGKAAKMIPVAIGDRIIDCEVVFTRLENERTK